MVALSCHAFFKQQPAQRPGACDDHGHKIYLADNQTATMLVPDGVALGPDMPQCCTIWEQTLCTFHTMPKQQVSMQQPTICLSPQHSSIGVVARGASIAQVQLN